jgi:hypothetical protein
MKRIQVVSLNSRGDIIEHYGRARISFELALKISGGCPAV